MCGLLAAGALLFLAGLRSEEAAESRKLALVVRVGMLAREELSPGSKGPAPEAWKLAAAGATLIHIEPPSKRAGELGFQDLRDSLFPPSVVLAPSTVPGLSGTGEGLVSVDLPSADAVSSFLAVGADSKPSALAILQAAFGSPPPPDAAEMAALGALEKAIEGMPADSTSAPVRSSPSEDGAKPFERLPSAGERMASTGVAGLQRARAAFIRVVCSGISPGEVGARDALLGRLAGLVGKDGHLLVVNLPDEGDGTAFFVGPNLAAGRVFVSRRPLAVVAAVAARLLPRYGLAVDGAWEKTEGARREDVLELFR